VSEYYNAHALARDVEVVRRERARRQVTRLYAPEQHEDNDNNQNSAQHTDTTVAIAIAVPTESATETAQQEDNEDY
jgi:hypothetical protein